MCHRGGRPRGLQELAGCWQRLRQELGFRAAAMMVLQPLLPLLLLMPPLLLRLMVLLQLLLPSERPRLQPAPGQAEYAAAPLGECCHCILLLLLPL